jgi:predicted amidohydrolase YtcJ
MYQMIKAGGRLVGIHTGFDKDIDNLLDIIEKASKDAGFTPEQIRAKRHTYDHLSMSPRPNQLPRIKNLGMVLGGWNMYIWEGQARAVLENYGEEAATWVVPRKSIRDAGVWQSIEIDRPIGTTNLTYFTVMYAGITRKDAEGRVNASNQAVSREAMLKSATMGAAMFVQREDVLGSLEPGKFAARSRRSWG